MVMRWALMVGVLVGGASPAVGSAGEFEGVLHMVMTTPEAQSGGPSKMDWYLKGDKARVEMFRGEAAANTMLIDAQTHTMQMAMPGQKRYMQINMGGERAERMQDLMGKQTVERTGKTEKVAGYSCEIWKISDHDSGKQRSEVCVAKGFGKAATFWSDPKDPRRSAQSGWMKLLADEGGFALRNIYYDHDGKEAGRMEVTVVEKKALDAALFAFPADWDKQDMTAMQEGLKGLREGKGPGNEELKHMLEGLGKRKGAAGDQAEQPDTNEMLKQFEEMLKKKQATH